MVDENEKDFEIGYRDQAMIAFGDLVLNTHINPAEAEDLNNIIDLPDEKEGKKTTSFLKPIYPVHGGHMASASFLFNLNGAKTIVQDFDIINQHIKIIAAQVNNTPELVGSNKNLYLNFFLDPALLPRLNISGDRIAEQLASLFKGYGTRLRVNFVTIGVADGRVINNINSFLTLGAIKTELFSPTDNISAVEVIAEQMMRMEG